MTFHLFLGSEIPEKREKHLHLLIQQASWDLYFSPVSPGKRKKWVPLESHYRLEVLPYNLNETTKIRCVWKDPNNRRFQRGILFPSHHFPRVPANFRQVYPISMMLVLSAKHQTPPCHGPYKTSGFAVF